MSDDVPQQVIIPQGIKELTGEPVEKMLNIEELIINDWRAAMTKEEPTKEDNMPPAGIYPGQRWFNTTTRIHMIRTNDNLRWVVDQETMDTMVALIPKEQGGSDV